VRDRLFTRNGDMGERDERFDGGVEVGGLLRDEDLSAIPAKRGVVLLTGAGGKPILLLTGADIRARVRNRLSNPQESERKKLPNLHEITQGVFWKLAAGHFETDLRFFELARSIWVDNYKSLLAWKPSWFVHVNVQEEFPRFVRTRDVLAKPGSYLGPFESARSAERFVEALLDTFDLCRDYERLRKSPGARRCAYGQMRRCLCPCDGTISMDEYRQVVGRALAFAAGDWVGLREELAARMKQAADALQFEQAANFKTRIDRLGEFDKREYAFVARAEEFRFFLIQPGGTSHQAKVFLVDRGAISEIPPLEYPLQNEQLAQTVIRMRQYLGMERGVAPEDPWRMGLVGHYLFSGGRRRGVILRWTEGVTPERLAEAVEGAAKLLRLKAPKRRGRGTSNANSDFNRQNRYNGRPSERS
jgi:excinuclease UvrABC nuclease subunit